MPFEDRPSFEWAKLQYKKCEATVGEIDEHLNVWAARNILNGGGGSPPFSHAGEMYDTIDAIKDGNAPWHSFAVHYSGPLTADSPTWKRITYTVHCRNSLTVAENIIGSADFHNKFDYTAFEEYTAPHKRRWSNVMSGQWAMEQSVSTVMWCS